VEKIPRGVEMKNKIAIVFWKDASIHGSDQRSREEWIKECNLVAGISVGHIVHEDKEKITLAMDFFPPDKTMVFDDQFRVTSTYPKSGIKQIIRKEISETEPLDIEVKELK
jgi:hypothetical protein